MREEEKKCIKIEHNSGGFFVLTKESVEAFMTIWLFTFFFKCSFVQLLEAKRTNKVLGMKLAKHGSNASARNRLWTSCTKWSFECMEMCFTIRSSFMFEKIAICKRLVASSTNEAIGVPLSIQWRNVILGNGDLTTSTFGCKHGIIAAFAISLVVLFVKTIVAESVAAFKTDKVIRVPSAVKGRNAFV